MKTFNSIKYFILLGLFFSFLVTDVQAAKYQADLINITGSVNINKDPSENGYIPFGRYLFTGDTQYNGPTSATGNLKIRPVAGSQFDRIDGQVAYMVGNGFYLVFGIRDSRGDTWPGSEGLGLTKVLSPGELLVSVITGPQGTTFTGQYQVNVNQIGYIQDMDGDQCKKDPTFGGNVCAIVSVNLTFNVSNSTCQIITAHNMAFTWTSLTPSEINNGSAEKKTAPVTMQCSNSGGIEPIAVTFTSSTGTYDADQGIVKTNLANLGIQLTWASSGLPVVMDKEIDIPAVSSSTEDLSVNAQPVQLASTSVGGGRFSTQVTMNIEYR